MANLTSEKAELALDELDAQVAVELPERAAPALLVITLITGDIITITLRNVDVNVAANVCAQLLTRDAVLDCRATAG